VLPWFEGLSVEKRSTELPVGYDLRYSNISNCTVLYCSSADIAVWPVLRTVGNTHFGRYVTLFAYMDKATFASLANIGDPATLWETIARRSPTVKLLSLDPARFKPNRLKKKYRIGRILEPKGMILDLLDIDCLQFQFKRDTCADCCLPIRVPVEWSDSPDAPLQLITADPRMIVKNSIVHRITADELSDACSAPEALNALLFLNADPNQTNSKGITPLIAACRLGSLASAGFLLEAHADPNACDKFGATALSAAIVNDNADLCRLLLANGADVHAVDLWGDNAIMLAVKCNRKEILGLLLSQGGVKGDRNRYGENVRDVARMMGDMELVGLLT